MEDLKEAIHKAEYRATDVSETLGAMTWLSEVMERTVIPDRQYNQPAFTGREVDALVVIYSSLIQRCAEQLESCVEALIDHRTAARRAGKEDHGD